MDPSKANPARPKTLKDACVNIVSRMDPDAIEKFTDTPEDDLITYHHTLGQFMRNEFRMWGGNEKLVDDCYLYLDVADLIPTPGTDQYPKHPDDMSFVIIRMLWLCLNRRLDSSVSLLVNEIIQAVGMVVKLRPLPLALDELDEPNMGDLASDISTGPFTDADTKKMAGDDPEDEVKANFKPTPEGENEFHKLYEKNKDLINDLMTDDGCPNIGNDDEGNTKDE